MRKDEFNIYEFHQKLYMKRDALDHINIKQRIKHIQKLLSQETLWLWFSTFITICEKYISIK